MLHLKTIFILLLVSLSCAVLGQKKDTLATVPVIKKGFNGWYWNINGATNCEVLHYYVQSVTYLKTLSGALLDDMSQLTGIPYKANCGSVGCNPTQNQTAENITNWAKALDCKCCTKQYNISFLLLALQKNDIEKILYYHISEQAAPIYNLPTFHIWLAKQYEAKTKRNSACRQENTFVFSLDNALQDFIDWSCSKWKYRDCK